jgi:hypothetical protein
MQESAAQSKTAFSSRVIGTTTFTQLQETTMKTKILCTALMALVAFSTARSDDGWEKFTPTNKKFSIQLPSEPFEQTVNQKTAFGNVQVHAFTTVDVDSGITYAVSTTKMPQIATDAFRQNPDGALDGVCHGMAIGIKGKITKKSKIKMGTHTGREVEIDAADGEAHMKARVFLVDGQLYMLMVISTKDEQDPQAAAQFFKSFEVLKANLDD